MPASSFRAEALSGDGVSPGSHGWVQKEVSPKPPSRLLPVSPIPPQLPSFLLFFFLLLFWQASSESWFFWEREKAWSN